MTLKLYNTLTHLEDFIDYYTVGAITYNAEGESMITVDPMEEYMVSSRQLNGDSASVNVSWEDTVSDISIRPVPAYEWGYEIEDWGIGSHPLLSNRDTDADGDAIYASSFTPTDMSNMFRNCSNFDLSRLD
jgi:hypothetical protein